MTDNQQAQEAAFQGSIEFVDDAERQYFLEAKLGHDIRMWLQSPAGRYLHERANIAVSQAKDAMYALDYDNEDSLTKARQLKQEAGIGEAFMRWCAEALINGENAETLLDSHRE